MASVISGVTEFANAIPEIWSSLTYDQLRANLLLGSFFERSYEGDIRSVGDTVRVNTFAAAGGEILTDDEIEFSTEGVSISQQTIVVNKRASAAYEITDLAMLQSMEMGAEVRRGLAYGATKQLEDDLITAITAGAGNTINPATASDLDVVDIAAARKQLSQDLVPKERRAMFLDPCYYTDLLNKNQIMSRDFTQGNDSEQGVSDQFLGFRIVEHNNLEADLGFAMHPSALQLVMQQGMRVKVSDQHSSRRYQSVISADMVYGYTLFDGDRIVKFDEP